MANSKCVSRTRYPALFSGLRSLVSADLAGCLKVRFKERPAVFLLLKNYSLDILLLASQQDNPRNKISRNMDINGIIGIEFQCDSVKTTKEVGKLYMKAAMDRGIGAMVERRD